MSNNETRHTEARRAHERFAVDMEAVVIASIGEFRARTRDLSRGGICFTLAAPLSVGEVFTVEISLVLGENRYSEALAIAGRVVWCTTVEDGHQIGAAFLALDQNAKEYLALFLKFLAEGVDPGVAGVLSGSREKKERKRADKGGSNREDSGLFA